MRVYSIAAFGISLVSIACFWSALKRLSVILDREDWWDLADLVIGPVAFLAFFSLQLALREYRVDAGHGVPYTVFAFRRAALFGFATIVAAWLVSVWLETEFDVDVPESLEPIERRIWNIHLGWIPLVDGGQDDA